MIVNNKCELIIKNHSRTLGGGTRNHATSLQIFEKRKKSSQIYFNLLTPAQICDKI